MHLEDKGFLVVMENAGAPPFSIARVFMVKAEKNAVRGRHAHKLCSQFLVCSSGEALVTCADGDETVEFLLNKPSMGLLIPPGIWSEQLYLTENTVLTVLCDRVYEAEDYIREYSIFLKFRKSLETLNGTNTGEV
jgi:dTDP-4-dehydrorhamnose 3,5-epimerase-like enzyme